MKSIKSLIFEQQAVPSQTQQPQQTPKVPQQNKGSQEREPYRQAAKMLVNITKNIDPKSEKGKQLISKLKKPMEQFINFNNLHDDQKLVLLFRTMEEEAKKQGVNDATFDNMLRIVGGTHPGWTKRVLNLHYSISPLSQNY